MAKTPEQMASNWQRGMAGAAQAYAAGTGAVSQSPTQAAAAQADKAVANFAAAKDRMVSGLNNVSLSEWKAACAAAGSRLASGAAKGAAKFVKAMRKMQPVHAAMKAASQAAGGGPAGAAAAIQVAIDAKLAGQTK